MPSPKASLSWKDLKGNTRTEEVNFIVDARDVVGLAGFPWIIIAANPQLSNVLIERYLQVCGIDGVARPASWIQRKRFMFRAARPGNPKGPRSDVDGEQVRAISIMRANPKVSARRMVYVLKEHGIKRQKDWVLRHRGEPDLTAGRTI